MPTLTHTQQYLSKQRTVWKPTPEPLFSHIIPCIFRCSFRGSSSPSVRPALSPTSSSPATVEALAAHPCLIRSGFLLKPNQDVVIPGYQVIHCHQASKQNDRCF